MKIKVAIVSGAVREVQFFETHNPEDTIHSTLVAFLMEPMLNGPDHEMFEQEELDETRSHYEEIAAEGVYQHDMLLVEDEDGFYVVSAA